ncbi:phage tail tape measure protein [Aerococcaceae bacterium DSM 109653]|uniref:Phage tail tape measure protein n=1 Tax=Fundicoccus ignavus TaxID=2664442 RepID=A0A844BFH0_9LACT|nr:phage tail tape measure protein [Fundicoccus ignavus]MRI80705.1 phage tail tape measure protein [Fundicoccus ignavus]
MSSFDVMAVIKANVSNFKSGLKEAEGSLTSFKQLAGSTFENIGGALSGFGTALTVGVTTPLVAAGTQAFMFAADMEDAMGATDQIFGDSAKKMKSWANDLESYYGIAESEALEYGNMMGTMLKNIGGMSDKEAASTAGELIELAGDLSAMFGGKSESAVQALTGALKGNTSMLDNYGIAANEALVKTKALEMGLSDGTGELTLQAKQAATLALIMEQTADAQGQAAREAEGASGSMKALVTELKNLSTELGLQELPIITPFIQKMRDLVATFREMTPEQQANVVKWGMIAAAIGPVLIVVGKIIAFLPSLIAGFKALGAVFAFITSPIGLVVAAIAAVVGVILYLWKTNEGFRNAVISAWEAVKEMGSNLRDSIVETFHNIVNSVKTAGDNIVTNVKSAWDNVVTSITNAIGKAKTAAGNVMQGIVDTITGWFSNFMSAGANIVGMIADGIKGAVGKVTGAISSVVSKIREYLPFSPAKTGPLKDIHRLNFGGTIADSIYRDAHKPLKAMQDLTSGIRNTWSNDVGRLQANVGGSIQRNIQTSVNVQNNGLNSMFAEFLAQRQYLVLDTGAFVGHTQHAFDMANGSAINLGKRIKR